MFEYLNTKIQCYTQANDASEKKKMWRLKKTLVRETKKREICNKVYNFFSSNLCLMFHLTNKGKMSEPLMGIDNHHVNFHGKILSLKKKSLS